MAPKWPAPASKNDPTAGLVESGTPGARLSQRSVNLRQLIFGLYILLVAGLGLAGGVLFKDAHDEYSRLEEVEAADRRRLFEAQARLREQEMVLDRLRHDPAFVDKVIRIRLGYAKPDEFIFRFEDDDTKGSAGPVPPSRTGK